MGGGGWDPGISLVFSRAADDPNPKAPNLSLNDVAGHHLLPRRPRRNVSRVNEAQDLVLSPVGTEKPAIGLWYRWNGTPFRFLRDAGRFRLEALTVRLLRAQRRSDGRTTPWGLFKVMILRTTRTAPPPHESPALDSPQTKLPGLGVWGHLSPLPSSKYRNRKWINRNRRVRLKPAGGDLLSRLIEQFRNPDVFVRSANAFPLELKTIGTFYKEPARVNAGACFMQIGINDGNAWTGGGGGRNTLKTLKRAGWS